MGTNGSNPQTPGGGEQPRLSPTQLAPLQERWSIGLYRGVDPWSIAPEPGVDPRIVTAETITDVAADFVADPFCHVVGDRTYLFFEIWNRERAKGEIACASSPDLTEWRYEGVALREPFHLSYPCVFAASGELFMIPETREARSVRLYRADRFPLRWRFVTELLRGDFADATPFHHRGRWWLFVHRGLDELRLYSALEPDGTFAEHPASPLVAGNRRVSRPAGRLLEHGGRIFRFAQDAWPNYGSSVRVLEVDRLSESEYLEHELPKSPILQASGEGWNALGMHHVELLPRPGGTWKAIVDGYTLASRPRGR